MPQQNNEKTTQGVDQRPGPLDGLLIADFSRVLRPVLHYAAW